MKIRCAALAGEIIDHNTWSMLELAMTALSEAPLWISGILLVTVRIEPEALALVLADFGGPAAH